MPRGKATTTAKVEEVQNEAVGTTTDKDKEILELKKREEAMNKKMEEMQQMMMQLQQAQMQSQIQPMVTSTVQQNKKLFKVISLVPNIYNLTTETRNKNNGREGKIFTFEKFGDSKLIQHNDILNIMEIYIRQFEKGMAILSSKEEYDELGYGYIYDMVLSKEKFEEIASLKRKEDVDAILSMDGIMQEKITLLIATNIADGVSYDYNRIVALEDEGIRISEIAKSITSERELDSDEE